jgi:hypothetical protein
VEGLARAEWLKARQAERYDAVLQRLLQHQLEKAAEHVAADGLFELVKDRPSRHRPRLLQCGSECLFGHDPALPHKCARLWPHIDEHRHGGVEVQNEAGHLLDCSARLALGRPVRGRAAQRNVSLGTDCIERFSAGSCKYRRGAIRRSTNCLMRKPSGRMSRNALAPSRQQRELVIACAKPSWVGVTTPPQPAREA